MATQTSTIDDNYDEYDEFDEEDGERGLSGLVVLLMGVVMLGAFASIVWIAYQQGVKSHDRREIPTVAASTEPLKIENDAAVTAPTNDRAVYDRLAGAAPADVEVIAQAPEEPVTRDVEDTIGAIAAESGAYAEDAAGERIAGLETDSALREAPATEQSPAATTEPPRVTAPTPAAIPAPEPVGSTQGAASGSHLVQVGAFKSQAEADGFWARMQTKLGDYVNGVQPDVERADLGDKGVFYRLRVGPFTTAADAKSYCEGLKSRGQDCLVRAN
jgi:cell division septation protein DedD